MKTVNHQLKIFLVEERPNPSTDFFFGQSLSNENHQVIRCRFSELPKPENLAGSIVLFIRYISSDWAKLIEANRHQVKKLIFFMDDDLLDFSASSGMPLRYRYKLARLAIFRESWLKRQQAELWVSTPYLERKYASWQPRMILPCPVKEGQNVLRLFYHGSASHQAEIQWLFPVIKNVLKENDKITFEMIGGADVNRMYGKLERVTILHPMKWSSYQALVSSKNRHIGLAPLLNLPFNQSRSYTKFFDIHRCGAVGIFSSNSYCAEIIEHNVDGLIVDLDQEAWVDAILGLAKNENFRNFLLANAEIKLNDLKLKAKITFNDLFSEIAQRPD